VIALDEQLFVGGRQRRKSHVVVELATCHSRRHDVISHQLRQLFSLHSIHTLGHRLQTHHGHKRKLALWHPVVPEASNFTGLWDISESSLSRPISPIRGNLACDGEPVVCSSMPNCTLITASCSPRRAR